MDRSEAVTSEHCREFELELAAGGGIAITLPAPGDFASFYVFSAEHCGNLVFWDLLSRLMAAAGRPVCAIHEALRPSGAKQYELARPSLHRLLRRRGYGFGMLYDADPQFTNVVGAESRKLLLLRDPRGALAAAYRLLIGVDKSGRSAPVSFAEFLESPAAERVAARYRRYAEFRQREPNVTLIRYEHALSGWHAIASDLVATLDLPIDPLIAASIARSLPPVGGGNRLPETIRPSRPVLAGMEAWLADVLAAFGYAPRTTDAERRGANVRISAEARPVPRVAPARDDLFEPDPVLLFRLKPNATDRMRVLGREVVIEIDAAGCRRVAGQPLTGEKTLAAYGCSCTFGTAIPNEETFCSLLQAMFPSWRVENHGAPAYSASRNLLQLERDAGRNKPEFVTFCWIPGHRLRNVADPGFVQAMSGRSPRGAATDSADLRLPRAALDSDGLLKMRSIRMPRHDLLGVDFSDFEADPWYMDLVTFRLFERANAIVTGYGGHFFVTTLMGKLSAALAKRLADAGIPIVDASVSGREYTCLPDDGHPNGLANTFFAERIRDHVLQYAARGGA